MQEDGLGISFRGTEGSGEAQILGQQPNAAKTFLDSLDTLRQEQQFKARQEEEKKRQQRALLGKYDYKFSTAIQALQPYLQNKVNTELRDKISSALYNNTLEHEVPYLDAKKNELSQMYNTANLYMNEEVDLLKKAEQNPEKYDIVTLNKLLEERHRKMAEDPEKALSQRIEIGNGYELIDTEKFKEAYLGEEITKAFDPVESVIKNRETRAVRTTIPQAKIRKNIPSDKYRYDATGNVVLDLDENEIIQDLLKNTRLNGTLVSKGRLIVNNLLDSGNENVSSEDLNDYEKLRQYGAVALAQEIKKSASPIPIAPIQKDVIDKPKSSSSVGRSKKPIEYSLVENSTATQIPAKTLDKNNNVVDANLQIGGEYIVGTGMDKKPLMLNSIQAGYKSLSMPEKTKYKEGTKSVEAQQGSIDGVLERFVVVPKTKAGSYVFSYDRDTFNREMANGSGLAMIFKTLDNAKVKEAEENGQITQADAKDIRLGLASEDSRFSKYYDQKIIPVNGSLMANIEANKSIDETSKKRMRELFRKYEPVEYEKQYGNKASGKQGGAKQESIKTTKSQEEFNKIWATLPSGAKLIAPNGKTFVKK